MKQLNAPTLLVLLLVAALALWAVRSLVRRKKKGEHVGCGGNCSSCPSAAFCTEEKRKRP